MSIKVILEGEDIVLDRDHLKFNETSINDYLQVYSGWYSYYCEQWAKAQFAYQKYENAIEQTYARKFAERKESMKASDKLADAYASADPEIVELQEKSAEARHAMQLLWGFIRSMDKSFDSALNVGYNIRKEMDKIFPKQVSNVDPSWFDANVSQS